MSAPEDFVDGYIECALWSSTETDEKGNMGRPLDDNYGSEDIAPETLKQMREDCDDFWNANEADLEPLDAGRCGHDFWLTRNRHGAGFWDRGLGEIGERLTKAAHVYGGVDLYAHDGKVYGS